ncbi:MAG: hypothetical protein J6T96_05385 [Bacteroidales bacterium]|nr:hypothetical protein [Bacteroidales bacterium]
MGYYTQFDLTVIDKNDEIPSADKMIEMGNKLSEMSEEFSYFSKGTDIRSMISTNEMKWYEYFEDMEDFSKEFPEYMFILSGYGEERNDTWIAHFQNGKWQQRDSEIIYDDFNPELFDPEWSFLSKR